MPGQANEHKKQPQHNKDDNRNYFNGREEKFEGAEGFNAHQVQDENQDAGGRHCHPQRDIGEPVREIFADRHEFGAGQRHGCCPVRPAANIPGVGAEVSGGDGAEPAGNGVANRHFTRTRRDNSGDHGANSVGDNSTGSRNFDGGTRAQKKAGSQGEAHRDHGHLTVREGTFQFAVAGCGVISRLHGALFCGAHRFLSVGSWCGTSRIECAQGTE